MSGYTTEEEYLDEDAVYIDYVGGPYGPPYNVPPQAPTPAPPAPAASSSEAKGKGKAKDEGAATLDQEIKERTEKEDTPERQANKEQLAKLASVDDFTVESLLRNDPTPTASLPTSTKIIKSLHLLQSMFQQANPDAPFPGLASAIPSFGGGFGARTPSPFPLETYASLLELLGSALQDVNSAPLAFSGAASSAARTKKTIYELQLERARLALNPDKAWVSPPTVMNNWGTVSPPSELTKEEKQMVDLSHLYSDQARAALLILRPPLFPPSPPEEPSSSTNPHLSTSTNAEGKTPSSTSSSSTCYISLLPSELLSHIFSLARALSAERLPLHGGHGGVGGYPGDPYDDYGAPRPIARRRPPGASSLEGSRTAAQRFALGLALTCRDWKAPARRIAFQSIHLRKAGQVEKLLKLVDGKGTPSAEGGEGGVREDLLGWVRKIDAKVVKAPDLGAGALAGIGVGRVRGYARFAGGMAWGVGGSSGGAGSAAAAKALEQEEETPAALFAKLVGKASGLRQLSLCVVGHPYSVGFGGRATIAEFLEPPILAALSSMPSLTSLSLAFPIDFEELEVILLGLPALEELRLQAIDSIGGSGGVASPTPHSSTRLRKFTLGDSQQFRDLTAITDVQLAWLLDPSASAGNLREVDVATMSGNPHWGGLGGVNQHQPQPPPFASGLVADLLLRTAPNLTRLALRDVTLGNPGLHASFNNAPHNGNFDHLLSHCTSLTDLTLLFCYTGPAFLDSVRSTASLTSLILLGTPEHTRAEDLASRLEGPVDGVDQFKKLERLVVQGQWFRGPNGGAGWTGSAVRNIKAVCRARKILCNFASS